jgi:Ca-activated chloride channel family protein
VKASLAMLAQNLTSRDHVAIVVYAGAAGLVLPPTRGDDRSSILEAIGRLEAGGSTNGAGGLLLAYRTAATHFVKGGVNRVILATDGDFNVGVRSG